MKRKTSISFEVVGGPKKDLVFWGVWFWEGQADLCLSGLGLRLLGQKHGLDVGQNTTLGDGDAGQKLVQLLVIADGQLKMTGDDSGLLVVTGGVSGQLQNFSGKVLEDGSQVHWGTGANTLSVVSLAQKSVDTSHGELKPGTR